MDGTDHRNGRPAFRPLSGDSAGWLTVFRPREPGGLALSVRLRQHHHHDWRALAGAHNGFLRVLAGGTETPTP
jgi:hypothetical protein